MAIDMTFEDYLISKKIDQDAFKQAEAVQYKEWKSLFEKVHPQSFTMQKKFHLNTLRRKYLLASA